jgi:hypothetical protein
MRRRSFHPRRHPHTSHYRIDLFSSERSVRNAPQRLARRFDRWPDTPKLSVFMTRSTASYDMALGAGVGRAR